MNKQKEILSVIALCILFIWAIVLLYSFGILQFTV